MQTPRPLIQQKIPLRHQIQRDDEGIRRLHPQVEQAGTGGQRQRLIGWCQGQAAAIKGQAVTDGKAGDLPIGVQQIAVDTM